MAGEPKATLARKFGISRDTLCKCLKPGPLDRRVWTRLWIVNQIYHRTEGEQSRFVL